MTLSSMIATVALATALALTLAAGPTAGAAATTWTTQKCIDHVNKGSSMDTASYIMWEGVKVPFWSLNIHRELVAPSSNVDLSSNGLMHDNVCRYNYKRGDRWPAINTYRVCANQRRGFSLFNSRHDPVAVQYTCQNGFVKSTTTCLTAGCSADMQQSGIGTAACTEDEVIHKFDKDGDLVGKTRVPDRFRTKIADSDYISCEHHIHTGRTCHPLLSPNRAPKLMMDLGVSYRCKGTAAEPADIDSCWKGCDPNTGMCKERDYVVDICKGIRCGRMCVDRWPQISEMHKTVHKWVEQSVSVLCVNEKIATKTVCRNKCQDHGHGRESKCT